MLQSHSCFIQWKLRLNQRLQFWLEIETLKAVITKLSNTYVNILVNMSRLQSNGTRNAEMSECGEGKFLQGKAATPTPCRTGC